MKKVSVITVNFNQAAITLELLRSILTVNTYKNLEIIVVDNASRENPGTAIATEFPNVKFIRSDVNLGFAGGNNLGIAAATGDYFFLVNNDTEFTEDLVNNLVEVLDARSEVAAISPRINYFADKQVIQYAGFTRVNFFTCRNQAIGKYQRDAGQFNRVVGPTAYGHGAAIMVKREATEKVGLMHDNYFLYFEEVDWCERMLQAGYQIWMRGDTVIYHKESVSVGKKSVLKEYFMNRNRILFIRRNAPFKAKVVFYIYFVFLVVPRNIVNYFKERNLNFIPVLFKAIWWNITNRRNSKQLGFTLKQVA